MTYKTRVDGRAFDETRPITAKVGVIKNAEGSAMFKIGQTTAYAAVYGPRELHPKFLQNPNTGLLRCNYNMMPFSGHGERVRPGQNRRAKEISMVTENALAPALDLKDYPNTVVDVFIELPQTDAGTRCAGICAASLALADAGFEMKDLVSSVAVGRVDERILADLNYDEEAYQCEKGVADIPVAMFPNTGEITLLQMDGDLSRQELQEALKLAKKVCQKIYEVQKQALKEKFLGESE
ncbi:exosome complex exonuclease Rrp41 [Candidatus Woesearchaeota archaeon]|nr:exosome complex exonuclease Rrp41 [Candidatus Woesearchaeota archaeon]